MVPVTTLGVGVIPFEQATDGVVPSKSQQLRRGDRRCGHRTAWNMPLSSLPSRKRWWRCGMMQGPARGRKTGRKGGGISST